MSETVGVAGKDCRNSPYVVAAAADSAHVCIDFYVVDQAPFVEEAEEVADTMAQLLLLLVNVPNSYDCGPETHSPDGLLAVPSETVATSPRDDTASAMDSSSQETSDVTRYHAVDSVASPTG